MNPVYPKGPTKVPPELTKPTSRFKLHAWLAVLALVAFIALYFTLTGWLGYTSFRLIRDGFTSGHPFIGALKATPLAFLFLFLVRGLFAVRRPQDPAWVEIYEEEEPQLFRFLHRLATEAGAPRVHRVFLSPDVDAAVLYDLSLFNFFLPSKKNLVVGMALLNSLSLGETKAVLAHEFGHFAQKSMLVGRWVYIGQQIAAQIIASRSFFDSLLDGISRIDIRIAWIGWIMKLLVWSVRAVLDTAFRFVTLSMRALSREMELQADLVSVSLTGSDALVHALHKLHGADDAFGRAFGFSMNQIKKGKVVEDIYTVQTRMLESIRRISTDETYGAAPPLPETGRPEHRVFPDRFAQPPKMWSTHPPNREREDNAKKTYVPASLDERESWLLLSDVETTRRQMTAHMLSVANGDAPLPAETLSKPDSIDEVDASFGKTYLDTRYKGLYLGRGIAQHATSVDQLFDGAEDRSGPMPERLANLYPDALVDELESWLDLQQEHATLIALEDGFLTAPGGLVRYRGEEVRRRDLGRVIEKVDGERDAALEKVLRRDRECRTLHRDAARQIGNGWEAYHRSLVALLHYAEHTEADLRDVDGFFLNVFHVVIADGRVSNAERRRLVSAATDAYDSLAQVFATKDAVYLPDAVAKRLEVASWSLALGDFNLNVPTEMNIGDWMQAADSWLLTVAGDLGALRACTLEVLLDAEEHIARCARGECEVGEAPTTALVPGHYVTLPPGRERTRQKKLDFWDRFILAEGIVPGAARLAVAGSILGAGLWLGSVAAVDHSIIVYNGLDRDVEVDVGGNSAWLGAGAHREIELDDDDEVQIRATTLDGVLVEAFEADVSNGQAQYVYNVAGASPLVEWTAVYGSAYDPGPRMMGAPRVTTTEAEILFQEPPHSASGSGSGTTMLVLDAYGAERDPMSYVSALPDGTDPSEVILAHARWDASRSAHLGSWLRLAADLPELPEVLTQRIEESGGDVQLLRIEQDLAAGDAERSEICARQRADLSTTGDGDYLAARCILDPAEQREAFLAGYLQYPDNPFFARAAGSTMAAQGRYPEAAQALELARRSRVDLAAEVAPELARVRRAVSGPNGATMHDLLPHSTVLQHMQGVEERAEWTSQGIGRSYTLLEDGRFEAAVDHAYGVEPEMAHSLLRLVAASEGAPPTLVERAHRLGPQDGLDYKTVWSAIALAQKSGRDAAPFIAEATEIIGEARFQVMAGWADPMRLREDLERLEDELGVLNVELRGQARVMGLITLGEEAPEAWREEARALLFSVERPRFGPAPPAGAGAGAGGVLGDVSGDTELMLERIRELREQIDNR